MKDLKKRDNNKKIKKLDIIKKFKSNNKQSVIFVVALMLVTAGYYNYLGKQDSNEKNNSLEIVALENQDEKIGEAKFVDSKIDENSVEEINTILSNINIDDKNSNLENLEDNNEDTNIINSVNTNSNDANDINNTNEMNIGEEKSIDSIDTANIIEYFANSRLEREKMYSQMLDVYQKILESSTISEEQKSIASNEIVKINNTKNAIMVSEDLIKNKNIKDCIIFVNGDSVNIVVQSDELTDAKTAQISEILTRELKVNIENVHISKK